MCVESDVNHVDEIQNSERKRKKKKETFDFHCSLMVTAKNRLHNSMQEFE